MRNQNTPNQQLANKRASIIEKGFLPTGNDTTVKTINGGFRRFEHWAYIIDSRIIDTVTLIIDFESDGAVRDFDYIFHY